jgi:hypothetical protein
VQLEHDGAAVDRRDSHRVGRRAAALGRRAGVEDLKAVALGVLREVRVPEDDGVAARELRPQGVEAPTCGAGGSTSSRGGSSRLTASPSTLP